MSALTFVGDHIFVELETIALLESCGLRVSQIGGPIKESLASLVPTPYIATWAHIDVDTAAQISTSENLKHVALMSTGFEECISPAAIRLLHSRGVTISYTPSYSTIDVAEFALGLMLMLRRKIDRAALPESLHPSGTLGSRSKGANLGIIGCGDIGTEVARLGLALGMNVRVNRKMLEKGAPEGTDLVSLPSLFANSDCLVIVCPLTDETRNLVGGRLLASMPLSAIVLNMARPDVMSPKETAEALLSRPDLTVAIDGDLSIKATERWAGLSKMSQVVWTPHAGFNSLQALHACTRIVAQNVLGSITGNPQNLLPNTVCHEDARNCCESMGE